MALLGIGLALQCAAAVEVSLTSPTAGATFATGAAVPLTAEVNTGGSYEVRIAKVEFFANGTLVATGQPVLGGQYQFPSGDFMMVPGPGAEEDIFWPPYTLSGTYPTPLSFIGTFSDQGTPRNVQISFSFQSDGTLRAAVTADAPIGNTVLSGAPNGMPLQTFSASWSAVTSGIYQMTAKAYYGAGLSVTSAPISITVGSAPAPPPTLAIRRVSATEMELSWPDDGASWRVQQQTGLAASGWLDQTGTPVLAANIYTLRVPMSGPIHFYRLAKP